MRTLFLLMLGSVAVAASGCMSETRHGDRTHTYDCSGAGKGWGDCSEKADAQCGANNYTVVSRNGNADGKDPGGTSEMKRTMVVRCERQP